MDTSTTTTELEPPLLWLLQGRKAGDNAQLDAVAAELQQLRDARVERIALDFVEHELAVTLFLGASMRGVVPGARSRIVPPWPDLVLTAGRRNEPVARWIRQASGDVSRLVHFGRPWAHPRHYDLVVTTPQYFLDADHHDNVLTLSLPPVAPPVRATVDPRGPLLLLIGGDSGSKEIDAAFALATLRRAAALARARGTTLRLSTSPRTPAQVEAALAGAAPGLGAEWYAWQDRRGGGNPYRGWLEEASAVVVTEDSMSMIADAAALSVPLWIARLPEPERPWWLTVRGWRWRSATHELAQHLAPVRYRRDTQRMLTALVDEGRAKWFGQGGTQSPSATGDRHTESDARRAATAVAALLQAPGDASGG